MIYIVEHFKPGFCGVMCGVDFFGGRGSTNSATTVIALVKSGCKVLDPSARAEVRVIAQKLARARRKSDEGRAKQDAFERTPAYTEFCKKRDAEREEAEKKARHESRPRRRFHR